MVRHYSTRDGLPHNVGYDLQFDREGHLWIGTDNGLARFDGQNFTVFNEDDGIQAPYIITLGEHEGTIWVGNHRLTPDLLQNGEIHSGNVPLQSQDFWNPDFLFLPKAQQALISEVHPSNFKNYFLLLDLSDSIAWESHYYFLYDQGVLTAWRLCQDDLHIAKKFLPENLALRFCIDDQENIIIGSKYGLFRWNTETEQPVRIFSDWVKKETISSLFAHSTGQIVVGGSGKIWRLDTSQPSRSKYWRLASDNEVVQITEVGPYLYWFERGNKEIFRLHQETGKIDSLGTRIGLKSDISHILPGQDETLWITTNGDGLYGIYPARFVNFQPSEGLTEPFINSVSESELGLLAASRKGVYRLKNQVWEKEYFGLASQSMAQSEIFEVFQYGPKILLSSPRGLMSVYPEPQLIRDESSKVSAVTMDGKLLQSGREMIVLYPSPVDFTRKNIFIKNRLRNDSWKTTGLKGHWENFLWVGTNQGLLLKRGEVYDEVRLHQEEILMHDALFETDSSGFLATNRGLIRFEGMNVQQTNFHDPVYALARDVRGRIWMGCPDGLFYYFEGEFYHFTTEDGLVANGINDVFIDRDDQLWISTSSGISCLDVSGSVPKRKPPVLRLDQILLNEESVLATNIRTLRPEDRIVFQFYAIEFQNPENMLYRYRLKATDEWSLQTGGQQISFRNLGNGQYQFELQVRQANSDWGESLLVPFDIVPRWYQRFWVQLSGAILLIALIILIAYLRVREIRLREEERTDINRQMANLELKALQAQMNPHFIFNALNAIQHFIIRADTESANAYLGRFSRLMRLYLESSKKRFLSLREELELLRLYLEFEHLCYDDQFTYEIEVDHDLHPDTSELPTMILQPFIENAIRHGLLPLKGVGRLKIVFSGTSGALICTIEDNGVGRKAAQKNNTHRAHRSRGLSMIDERIHTLQRMGESRVEIETRDANPGAENPGTLVRVVIPQMQEE
ncbi:MAG: histidine kinase [Bacteroidota bacterium]